MFESDQSGVPDALAQLQSLRRTGLDPIGDKPWGTHIALFYETLLDVLDVHARYFGAGLASGEHCIWALSGELTEQVAVAHLRRSIPGFEHHLRQGHIEFVDGRDWYLTGNEFDPGRVLNGWHRKLDHALARGFAGLRVSGNAFWCETGLWRDFCEYEAELDQALDGRKMIVLCTYSLAASRATDMLDVARAHQVVVSLRDGRWELLERPERATSKRARRRSGARSDVLSRSFRGREGLTRRERAVLAQLIQGASSKEAARALKISPRTVDFHRANIMRKLGARNIVELMSIVLGVR